MTVVNWTAMLIEGNQKTCFVRDVRMWSSMVRKPCHVLGFWGRRPHGPQAGAHLCQSCSLAKCLFPSPGNSEKTWRNIPQRVPFGDWRAGALFSSFSVSFCSSSARPPAGQCAESRAWGLPCLLVRVSGWTRLCSARRLCSGAALFPFQLHQKKKKTNPKESKKRANSC